MSANVRVNIENFRAIHKAEIKIDGITLVAGENGCGKSTLSKLLYFLYKTVSNYENIVKEQLVANLDPIFYYLQNLVLGSKLPQKDKKELREDFRKINIVEQGFYQGLIDKIKYLFKEHKILEESDPRLNRFIMIIEDILEEKISKDYLFDKIQEIITNQFKGAEGRIKSRPIHLFTNELTKEFSDSKFPTTFDVFEHDVDIVSFKNNNLSIPYTIQNTIYIDTPMVFSMDESKNTHWQDLNELLRNKRKTDSNSVISDIQKVIQGDTYLDDDLFGDDFKYKRLDGKTFDLSYVATGIKAFSILQLLLKGGHLNDKTLLIIDEPESNLHPQWIVEYARIIVNLNKHLGVKFFLASHNPDMVSAIRYISEKEGVLEDVNFYLAEKEKETFTYNYKHLEKEIDPIFESFNIAIDRINKYSV
ncbi:conserved hypothetical protein [Capnocytophaga canis]|uniref:Endonuclease GajA/Old nuclease/RecF-like AAA domain-containing protein n=1 Tax=Capnocytophaga canis TaxID=1848903 RepID=A0A0B7I2L0_9FLAO|nr:AAA family ATPase [Capnocytophaga canis]CEN44021.1 conserved hypothetical protein [Capnocytophaga canis]CEN45940.1 conserved hypothetical protein [Capnocytophaga canis]CEN54346.1 conserved hypothetical protein [Capnocytophaga canis]